MGYRMIGRSVECKILKYRRLFEKREGETHDDVHWHSTTALSYLSSCLRDCCCRFHLLFLDLICEYAACERRFFCLTFKRVVIDYFIYSSLRGLFIQITKCWNTYPFSNRIIQNLEQKITWKSDVFVFFLREVEPIVRMISFLSFFITSTLHRLAALNVWRSQLWQRCF